MTVAEAAGIACVDCGGVDRSECGHATGSEGAPFVHGVRCTCETCAPDGVRPRDFETAATLAVCMAGWVAILLAIWWVKS